jgi:hypothetical protein
MEPSMMILEQWSQAQGLAMQEYGILRAMRTLLMVVDTPYAKHFVTFSSKKAVRI